ncbi:MAG: hypothetical protein R3B89_04720 [Polyangiaceae bacterium]
MTSRTAVPRSAWLLVVALFAERFAAHVFHGEFIERAMAGGLSRRDALWTLTIGDAWAMLGFALGAALATLRPRLAAASGVTLALMGALYSTQSSPDWRVVAVLVSVGSACSVVGMYAAWSQVVQRCAGVSERIAPIALFVFAYRLAPLLAPERSGGISGSVLAWGIALGFVWLSGLAGTSYDRGETNARVSAQAARGWFGAGALVIPGAVWVANSLVVPGEFEAAREVVFEWCLCLFLLVIALLPPLRAWLSARRAIATGLVVSAGTACWEVFCYELHVPFVTWVWVVGAAAAGALLFSVAFAVLASGGRRVSVGLLFAYFFISHGASSVYYLYQDQRVPGGPFGVLVALLTIPLLLAFMKWERRFSRLLMLDA